MDEKKFIDNCIETAKALALEFETDDEVQAMLDGLFALIVREYMGGRIQDKNEISRFCKASTMISFEARYDVDAVIGKPDGD